MINKSDSRFGGRPILSIARMITDRIGLHLVLVPFLSGGNLKITSYLKAILLPVSDILHFCEVVHQQVAQRGSSLLRLINSLGMITLCAVHYVQLEVK